MCLDLDYRTCFDSRSSSRTLTPPGSGWFQYAVHELPFREDTGNVDGIGSISASANLLHPPFRFHRNSQRDRMMLTVPFDRQVPAGSNSRRWSGFQSTRS